MDKDDKYGLAGVIFCSAMAWYDEWWRPFWASGAILLGVWTAIAMLRRDRP